MSPRIRMLVVWGPRLAGIALSLSVALFALDAFDGRNVAQVLPDFALHLMPAALVALVVAVAWRFPWVGAVGFGALAAAYAMMVPHRLDWILLISGPLTITAVLFAMNGLLMKAGPQARESAIR